MPRAQERRMRRAVTSILLRSPRSGWRRRSRARRRRRKSARRVRTTKATARTARKRRSRAVSRGRSANAPRTLHYAFTQFEEPESWKFNKARQNWIIRNVWSEQAVPETYLPLVYRYLQGVQGGSREALIKSCKEAAQATPSTDSTVPAEEQQEAPTEPESQPSPTKRTVKFAEPEAKDSKASDNATSETKRQRAASLLAILTSSTS
ncbi:hypothetical protein C8Q70DRAFT_493546 [Cubamyces menziesii]|nr:hypothetical protein C8Q70DRAFT_493546 [Cubamyces menziesii]